MEEEVKLLCPHCLQELSPLQVNQLRGKLGGMQTSAAKSRSSKINGKKGGRPKRVKVK